jgi:hypothetical protein
VIICNKHYDYHKTVTRIYKISSKTIQKKGYDNFDVHNWVRETTKNEEYSISTSLEAKFEKMCNMSLLQKPANIDNVKFKTEK